jgi:hypothetical protein
MTSEAKINDLIEQLQETPRLATKRQHDLRDELDQSILAYFAARLVDANGQIPTELRQFADQLYDLPGMAPVLVSALRLDGLGELRNLLGRTRQIPCCKCATVVNVLEPRKKGGYSTTCWVMCPACRQEQREQVRERHEAATVAYAMGVRVDAQLQGLATPLDLPHFVQRLREYRAAWRDRQLQQYAWFTSFQVGGGCMICDANPVDWWLITDRSLTEESWVMKIAWPLLDPRAGLDQDVIWAELTNMAQVLWRLSPQEYLSVVPHFPLKNMPFLALCAPCSQRIEIERTHQVALVVEEAGA